MILRVIRGRAGREQLEAFRATLDERLRRAPGDRGPIRHHVAARPAGDDCDALVLVLWRSFEDAAAADVRGESAVSIAGQMELQLEPSHFEVDETIHRGSDDEPVAVRIATGRFSKPGADIEMLDLLRERVPLVGDEMCEAYVGRRIVERMVDITFISTWRRFPADRRLDETFWQDIALRYDSFSVDVFTPVSGRTADWAGPNGPNGG